MIIHTRDDVLTLILDEPVAVEARARTAAMIVDLVHTHRPRHVVFTLHPGAAGPVAASLLTRAGGLCAELGIRFSAPVPTLTRPAPAPAPAGIE
ncbi:hypothetical protein ACN20G_28830 (plasmid) [Streptomyces sp. BI20]|uniref:hypothetical protein n=1 Tax=Streptomyces sp. BI20 TaxID=3403460 RepID=UPI003C780307